MSLLDEILSTRRLALTEASVYERVRRHAGIEVDPDLAHASAVYEPAARSLLAGIHREYLAIGGRRRVPLLALTDTWRASAERVERSRFRGRRVNADNVSFLLELREEIQAPSEVLIGGNLGPRGDAYRPEEAPDEKDAERLHRPQIEELASSGIDFLQASTLPALAEARGMARAMSGTGTPYFLSFVVRASGHLLDGTPLPRAIESIDDTASRPPAGYFVNCVHPSVLLAALESIDAFDSGSTTLPARLRGLQANASRLSPEELDGRAELDADEPDRFGAEMAALHGRFGLHVLGGCCGTDSRHIEATADALDLAGTR
jgi:S-methylmethionine-dependent homocysteine/selenocysteine methylase